MTRNRASAKKAGTAFESMVAEFLSQALADDRIERRSRNGAKDRGDIGGVRTVMGGRLVIECKNVTRPNDVAGIGGWLREAEVERGNDDAVAGVVAHKRHGSMNPADQLVTMTLATFARLVEGGQP